VAVVVVKQKVVELENQEEILKETIEENEAGHHPLLMNKS
jgi:hypothetical protein